MILIFSGKNKNTKRDVKDKTVEVIKAKAGELFRGKYNIKIENIYRACPENKKWRNQKRTINENITINKETSFYCEKTSLRL